MDIIFSDPSDVPLPPDEVRIRNVDVEPYPDGRRIRVTVELSPFLKKPSGEITIFDQARQPVAITSFIESITPKIELTMHLRSLDAENQYILSIVVFYAADFEENDGDEPVKRPEQTIVDEKEFPFKITT